MKKLLTVLLTITLLSFNVNSQIKINELPTDSLVYKKTACPDHLDLYKYSNGDLYYTYTYKNAEFTHITDFKSIKFKNKEEAIQFFVLVQTFLLDKKEISFDLNGDFIVFKKGMMGTCMIFNGLNKGYFYLTKNETNKILASLN